MKEVSRVLWLNFNGQAKSNFTTRPHLQHMIAGLRRQPSSHNCTVPAQDPSPIHSTQAGQLMTASISSSWLSGGFYCCEKLHYQKQPGEGKVYSSVWLESSIKGSQEKTWRQDLKQKSWRNVANRLFLHGLFSLLSYTS